LRGVNVGAHGTVAMPELVELLDSLGWARVRTYIRSGNVVFQAPTGPSAPASGAPGLAALAEAAFAERFCFSPRILVLRADELAGIVRADPFAGPGGDLDGRYVTFLMDEPSSRSEDDLRALAGDTGADRFALGTACAWVYCPDGYRSTKLSNSFFEKALGVAATTRNLRTVTHLLEMAAVQSASGA
jgi:uncharacterized protein (DUF1697 family)